MSDADDLVAIPPMMQGIVDGMRQATKQKWYEAAIVFFIRSGIACQTFEACKTAGFTEAQTFFAAKTVYYMSESLRCLAEAHKLEERYLLFLDKG